MVITKLGRGAAREGRAENGFSERNHRNIIIRIRETKGKKKNKHLQNTWLLHKQNLQTLASWSRHFHEGAGYQANQMP